MNRTLPSLRAKGIKIAPILETCCVCVLNATYNYTPVMDQLLAVAVENNFSGYMLDIVCGATDAKARGRFFDAFAAKAHPLGLTLGWWSHYSYFPELSFPNAADYVFTMDSYYYANPKLALDWLHIFKCQGGIGLDFPANGDEKLVAEMFGNITADQTSQAIGTWGYVPHTTSLGVQWYHMMTAYRKGWHAPPKAAETDVVIVVE